MPTTADERYINLEQRVRPLKCAYLVKTRGDVLDAMRLFSATHSGVANLLLPLPQDEEIGALKRVLSVHDPDYVFIPSPYADFQEQLKELPLLPRPIAVEEIENFSVHGWPLRLRNGILPATAYIADQAYPYPIQSGRVKLVRAQGEHPYREQLALLHGLGSEEYLDFIEETLAAERLQLSQTFEGYLTLIGTLSKVPTPLDLTLEGLTLTQDSDEITTRLSDPQTLCLYLDDGQGVATLAAYWNGKRASRRTSFLLPKAEFLSDLTKHLDHLLSELSEPRTIIVFLDGSREEAEGLRVDLQSAVAGLDKKLFIFVKYANLAFDVPDVNAYSSRRSTTSQLLRNDNSVRFIPQTPEHYSDTDFEFQYEVEVKFPTGGYLSLPKTPAASVLLSNEMWRIERSLDTSQSFPTKWLSRKVVRASDRGIKGLTKPQEEATFFLHNDEDVLRHLLRDRGFDIRPNDHTRYASGFMRRFGSFFDTMRLVQEGGYKVVQVLGHEGTQGGLHHGQLIGKLCQTYKMSDEESRKALDKYLLPLLKAGLIRRGYALKCPHCYLTSWYPIESVAEEVECVGCVERFQLETSEAKFHYRANELATNFVRSGGTAVLTTAATLHAMHYEGQFMFGGDVHRAGENNNFCEIDLLFNALGMLAVAECKERQELDEETIEELKVSLQKTIEAAKLLGADFVFLSIVTLRSTGVEPLRAFVESEASKARKDRISVHLICNGQLYPWGKERSDDPKRQVVSLSQLTYYQRFISMSETGVGQLPKRYRTGFGFTTFGDFPSPDDHKLDEPE